jgi:glucose/arabinose dehydrogenase
MRIVLNFSIILSLFLIINLNAQFTLEEAFPNISFVDPVDLQNSGDGTNRIFVVERAGRIKVFTNSQTVQSSHTFLNITDRVAAGGEMGLLGLAFHPEYETNRYFYVNYTVSNPRMTRISRFSVSSTNPDSADKNSELILLSFNQPFPNHNGGWIGFRPNDGYLYIGVGDGGSGGDPQNHGQNVNTILGNILRIDVDNQDPGLEYAIPPDNPFVDSTGSEVKEIYAWGLRNPWRNSFDPVTGWLWCGDVGQNAWEEIDIIEKGKNYGWRCYEGNHTFNTVGCGHESDYVFPIWEYVWSPGYSVTGGYVYRGLNVPELTGKYIYADYGSNRIWALEYDGINPVTNEYLLNAPGSPTSFGVDENDELYVVTFNPDKIYRFTPTVSGIDDFSIRPGYFLEQNYPNPFNPSTSIDYQLVKDGFVSLIVFNSLGGKVTTLVNEFKNAGSYNINFDASELPSGIYFYTLKAGNYLATKKMIFIK